MGADCNRIDKETTQGFLLRKARDVIDNYIKFKKCPNGVNEILNQLKQQPDFQGIPQDKLEGIYEEYKDICEELDDLNQIPAGKKAAAVACELAVLALKKYHPYYSACVAGLDELLQIGFENLSPKIQQEYVEALAAIYGNNLDGKLFKKDSNIDRVLNQTGYILQKMKVDDEHTRIVDILFKLFHLLGKQELSDDEGYLNTIGSGYRDIISGLLVHNCHNKNALPLLKNFLPDCTEWRLKDSDELDEGQQQVQQLASVFVERATETLPELAGQKSIEDLVKLFLRKHDYASASNLTTIYAKEQSQRHVIDKYIKHIADLLFKLNDSAKSFIMQLFWEISRHNPKILEPYIELFEPLLEDPSNAGLVGQIYTNVARNNPSSFKGKGQKYFDRVHKANVAAISYCLMPVFQQIATINESEANRAVSLMENEVMRSNSDKGLIQNMLYYWGIIAQQYPQPLRKRMELLREMLKKPELKQSAQHVIDVLEGRSLAKVSKDVEQQQEDIDEMDNRVTQNEEDIDELSTRADKQEQDMGRAKADIAEQEGRVFQLQERVDDVEEDVEELDKKTVSNAPAWAKEVSKLLNPRSNKDYRLVAQRLGYSPQDIRGWATQPDPTMSLLAEFYTTNKTSEATHYLLSVLKEIDRQDVVRVIHRYQKGVQDVVQNYVAKYEKPPAVFLSYQWGHQNQVKLLKQYLEKDGFSCWMDIGQMGGGDNLYKAINDGIRGSKLVVACMSEKYCKSANCIREINLSNGLGKRIIPLQMEKISWPPPGSLGPIMAEKLFIRFYQRENETTKDERYWLVDKYKELVDQLKELVQPDFSIIDEAATKNVLSHKSVETGRTRIPVADTRRQKVQQPVNRRRRKYFESNKETLSPVGRRKEYDILISCSPDCIRDATNLASNLRKNGYDVNVVNYTGYSVSNFKCNTVICALSTRYIQSRLASNEVIQSAKMNRCIIPLIMDDAVQYPPEGATKSILVKKKPINCVGIQRGATWNETKELHKIMERLGEDGDNGEANTISFTNEISQNTERQHSHFDYKDDGYNTAEEKTYAKTMQNGYQLPELDRSKQRRRRSQPTEPRSRIRQGPAPANPPRKFSGSLGRQGADFDFPKLPSVYRQRFKIH